MTTATRTRQRYARERHLFDAWANWCERQWDEQMGLPRVTWLAKLMQYGERVGVIRAAMEPAPYNCEADDIEHYMAWLKGACPPMHSALMARHRGICRERKAETSAARHSERYYAACLLEDNSPSGVQRFRRLCEQGYRLYRDGAGRPRALN